MAHSALVYSAQGLCSSCRARAGASSSLPAITSSTIATVTTNVSNVYSEILSGNLSGHTFIYCAGALNTLSAELAQNGWSSMLGAGLPPTASQFGIPSFDSALQTTFYNSAQNTTGTQSLPEDLFRMIANAQPTAAQLASR